MPTISLFKRVTRYVRHDAVDPGENRLTEVFASVLEQFPDLPERSLPRGWIASRTATPR